MSEINFTSLGINQQNISPELKKRVENQQNYTSHEKEQPKQDSVEISQGTQNEAVKENFIFRGMRKLGCKDPKKTLKSLGATVAMVAGLAVLGNKSINKMSDLGIKVDKFLLNQNWFNNISKKYDGFKNFFSTSLFKQNGNKIQKLAYDIKDTLSNKFIKPVWNVARGYGRGFVSIISLTPVDILQKSLNGKNVDEAQSILEKLVGSKEAKGFAEAILNQNNKKITDNKEFCEMFSDAIRKHFKCQSTEEFNIVLQKLKNGELGDDVKNVFNNVTMKEKGPMALQSSWWPVNLMNKIGSAITGKELNFGKGNLGDSLIKFNIVDNKLADTKLGSLVQKSVLIPTESISNFVNDKSGMGFFLGLSYLSTLNNVQDAPKDKKVGTLADDLVGTIGSIAIATPLAFKTTYGLASLSNVEGKGIGRSLARGIGNIFSVGLHNKQATTFLGKIGNGIKAYGGGIGRFAMLMFVLTPIFQKPIRNVIHKIFGKPYDALAEEKAAQAKAQAEAEANKVIPELGITQGEFIKKIQSNPKAVEQLQANPELVKKLQGNPRLLIDYLDGKDVTKVNYQAAAPQNMTGQNQTINKTPNQTQQIENNPKAKSADTATYIPSSKAVAQNSTSSTLSQDKSEKLNQALARADKALESAQKYI